jgi:putative tryptophan/tyrosine transport system substrate-binding protein
MRRRNLIFGLLAVTTMRGAHAQQSKKAHRIAVVEPSMPAAQLLTSDWGMWRELRRLGYVEGENLLIDRYSGEDRAAHNPDLAREVVRRNPDVIIAFTTYLVLDFKPTTSTIPIVGLFAIPVEAGIVQSLARPGGNITGVSDDIGSAQWSKRIQLLRQVVPQVTRLALLTSRSVPDQFDGPVRELCRVLGATPVGPPLDYPINEAEYRRVFAAFAEHGADAIMAFDTSENFNNRRLIAELAEKHRLPAICPFRQFVEVGGLMSYGINLEDVTRYMAGMVDRILKGAKPADIPIYQPTKFELLINLKAATALGLTIPAELRAVADEEIE